MLKWEGADLERPWISEKPRERSECGARRDAGCRTCKAGACSPGSISLTKKKTWVSSEEASEMLKWLSATSECESTKTS